MVGKRTKTVHYDSEISVESGNVVTDHPEIAGKITPTATGWTRWSDTARLTLGKRVKMCKMEALNGC